ncbi:hypothetical protein SERLA73DRAFT_158542 [Serpula lacrymans var. lacrymans S7.3]|uniref:Uncharacterized protein n=1 Tax=Serpula lacrymans var. lacrymans (strain S7.3) TaxID=936435 RepID=F8PMD0_SERL3|nr:hypothetical protein SERLA73DRAFT_158542 [Serpula lacrymans var. lacrymans S7.3]
MARATRSTLQHSQKDDHNGLPHPHTKLSKKRKRSSISGIDDQPAHKQLRTETDIKEEGAEDNETMSEKDSPPSFEHAGDVPIDSLVAQKILDILEMIDTQGLLDRVFPLPSNFSEPSTSKSQTGSYSFRTLLKDSSRHPLSVLRSAVQHLLPISYHPRSRPLSPAAQQLRFCDLALSLLDQASVHPTSFPLDLETILSDFTADAIIDDAEGKSQANPTLADKSSLPPPARRYALMQRLPSGNWWSSLNSEYAPLDGKGLKDLSTAHAELVAVLPSPSTMTYKSDSTSSTLTLVDTPVPSTLGSYTSKKPPGPKMKLPEPRRISCGSFLHYGPYASFAPTFDQEGVEIGRAALGEVIWRWEGSKKAWNKEVEDMPPSHVEDTAMESLTDSAQPLTEPSEAEVSVASVQNLPSDKNTDVDELEGLLSSDQVSGIKAVLGSLELEDAVQELLERNRTALRRLGELQTLRLAKAGDTSAEVEEDSEEWDTAQGILDSLVLLASLRPRSSTSEVAPLVPSASALRKLHRTLPTAAIQGWYGTLPPGRTSALRDDSTLYIKSGTTAPVTSAAPTPAPAPVAVAPPTTATPAQAYPGYAYSNFSTPFRGGYQYKPGQPSYYPSAYTAQVQGQNQQVPAGAPGYYPNQQYNPAAGQHYSYSSWYYQQPPPPTPLTAATGAANSGRGTPQPGAVAQQRAVANTVVTAATGKPPQQNAGVTWAASGNAGQPGYVAPTLPPHLRGISQPGLSGTYGGYQHSYYGYQPTPSTAR